MLLLVIGIKNDRKISGLRVSLASCFVEPAAADVANPFDDVVVGVVEFGFEYFEIADLGVREREREGRMNEDPRENHKKDSP
jgi:hypothetical protein